MTCARLPLTFCIDKDSPIDTLEAVLAIARRGRLRLSNLHLQAGDTGDLVRMELLADGGEPLDLFELRLRNLYGVFDIERLPVDRRRHACMDVEILYI